MKVGDLVRFTLEACGCPEEDRPIAIVVEIESFPNITMVTVCYPTEPDYCTPYLSDIEDFEVVSASR